MLFSDFSGNNVPEGEKKVCLWPTGNGTTCGKTFTKFDSLKRHLAENHKGVRPYACSLCEKTYGRRDYLQRHLKSHNANYAVNLQSASSINASQVVQQVKMPSKNTIILQQGQGGTLQVYYKLLLQFFLLYLFILCKYHVQNEIQPIISPSFF